MVEDIVEAPYVDPVVDALPHGDPGTSDRRPHPARDRDRRSTRAFPPLPAPGAAAGTPLRRPLAPDQPVVPASEPAVLVVEGLNKHFGGVVAVDNWSFRAPKGQVTGLIGPHGGRRGTSIDLISGFKL